jgi:RNA polymerase sigma factor (sigma-70 family)
MGLGPKGVVLAKIFEADLENGKVYYNKIMRSAARASAVGKNNADDFVQDFYLITLRAAETYRYDITKDMIGRPIKGPLNTWLSWRFKGLISQYIKMAKRRPLSLVERESRDEDVVSNDCLADERVDVVGDVINNARRDVVLSEIARLPTHQRSLAFLCYYKGMSLREAERVVGIPRSTGSYYLRRIKKKLAGRRNLALLSEEIF